MYGVHYITLCILTFISNENFSIQLTNDAYSIASISLRLDPTSYANSYYTPIYILKVFAISFGKLSCATSPITRSPIDATENSVSSVERIKNCDRYFCHVNCGSACGYFQMRTTQKVRETTITIHYAIEFFGSFTLSS